MHVIKLHYRALIRALCVLYQIKQQRLTFIIILPYNISYHRKYVCDHCKATGLHHEMVSIHKHQCPTAKIVCPNENCSATLLRCHLESHRAVCPNEAMDCTYSRVGCRAKPLRRDMQNHELECAVEHARLSLRGFRLEELELTKLRMILADLQVSFAPATFRMTNFREYMSTGQPWNSSPFFTHQGGYKMHLSVNVNRYAEGTNSYTYLSVFAYLMAGQYDSWLQWPFKGALTIQLLNQVCDEHHQAIVVEFKNAPEKACERVMCGFKSSCGFGKAKFIQLEDLDYGTGKETNYLMEDCLYFRVSVKAEKPWLACSSH